MPQLASNGFSTAQPHTGGVWMVMAALVAFVAGVPFTKSLTVPTWSMAAAAKEDVEEEVSVKHENVSTGKRMRLLFVWRAELQKCQLQKTRPCSGLRDQ